MRITPQTKVTIDAVTMQCIRHWVRMASGEVSCLAEIGHDLVVTDAVLLEQECTATSTELDQEAVAAVLLRHERPERLRVWVHSHCDMQVYWSQQDEETIEALANDTFLLSIVVNKKGAVRCRIDLFHPVRVTLDNLAHEVLFLDEELEAWCRAEFNDKVTEHRWNRTHWGPRALVSQDPLAADHRVARFHNWHLPDFGEEGGDP